MEGVVVCRMSLFWRSEAVTGRVMVTMGFFFFIPVAVERVPWSPGLLLGASAMVTGYRRSRGEETVDLIWF